MKVIINIVREEPQEPKCKCKGWEFRFCEACDADYCDCTQEQHEQCPQD